MDAGADGDGEEEGERDVDEGMKGWRGRCRVNSEGRFCFPGLLKEMTDGLVRAIGRLRANHDVHVSFRGLPERLCGGAAPKETDE